MVAAHPSGGSRSLVHGPPDGLCLAFANTKSWRGSPVPTEDLHGPADLLRWCAGALDAEVLRRVSTAWEAQPEAAASDFAQAIALREAIFRIFAATASGGRTAPGDVDTLNAALAMTPGRSRLRCEAGPGCLWEVPAEPPGLGLLLAPVLWSAGDLLAGSRLRLVRQCANEKCLWLFLDDSKSGNRRWCSMASCGNRAKAHRHYARLKDRA